jgi:hypothetical protein
MSPEQINLAASVIALVAALAPFFLKKSPHSVRCFKKI